MKLSKTYQPQDYEQAIYRQWEEAGAFRLEQQDAENFVTILPPPNANADLHVGYALDSQLKDILARWRRLQGRNVLLLPGADHAGFETWAVYEKYLNSQGKSRFDFEREELYRQVYDFVIENKNKMKDQIRRLGISCDWQQFTFTLDDKIVRQSYQTFKEMWQADLIYRGRRLVNYCVAHDTGFSDFEVSFKEVDGQLYFIKYPFLDSEEEHLVVATTRPETLLGDVAVAVNPEDDRYRRFEGRSLKLPVADRRIPLISHPQVLSDFGSGAVKITPGHDFLDFEIGQSAGLEPLSVIGRDGRMAGDIPDEFKGLTVAEARQLMLKCLKEGDYLLETRAYSHQVGHCYKCETILEPLLGEQWFVRMQPLAQAAIKRLKDGAIKFYPAGKCQELINYLNQLQDWNISRQIAWGIPIPVFQNENDTQDWIFDERVDQKTIEVNGQKYRRDPDVFDTWWSSGQWPFATVDWQNAQVYPQTLMETGVDILRPWVSRMILLSLLMTKQIPFETVYLHGMVVDDKGAKMSKSKGNVVNPMEMIDEYSSDALRLSLCTQLAPAQPQKFNRTKLVAGRNFCNKLWNIGRYVQAVGGDEASGRLRPADDLQLQTVFDHWIWQRFLQAKQKTDEALEDYQLASAWQNIVGFIWNDLADWYLEVSKENPNKTFLNHLYLNSLRLVHPFAPFVSEALYQTLNPDQNQPPLIKNVWPDDLDDLKADGIQAGQFEAIRQTIVKIRQLLPTDLRPQSRLILENPAWLEEDLEKIWVKLTGVNEIKITDQGEPRGILVSQAAKKRAWLILEKDLIKTRLDHLNQELTQLQEQQSRLGQRLQNRAYLDKAPAHLIEETKRQSQRLESELENLRAIISEFQKAL